MLHKTGRFLMLVVFIVLTILLIFGQTSSHAVALATTHYVAPGGACNGYTPCYASIQAAVDAASHGDTILVAEGTYTGVSTRNTHTQLVYLDKSLTIRGGYSTAFSQPPDPVAHQTILNAEELGRVFYIPDINAANIVLDGLRLIHGNGYEGLTSDNCGSGVRMLASNDDQITLNHNWVFDNVAYYECPAIHIWRARALLTDNSIFDNNGMGVQVEWNSDSVNLTNNIISNNGIDPLDIAPGSGARLEAYSVNLSGNMFSGNGLDGAVILSASDLTVQDNTFSQNLKNGLVIMDLPNGIIRDNTFEANGRGANLSGYLQIVNNTFRDNYDPSGDGVNARGAGLLLGYGQMDIFYNLFTGNQSADGGAIAAVGIMSDDSIFIRGNRFLSNQSGDGGAIYLLNAGTNVVESNFISGNQGQYGGGLAVDEETTATLRGNMLIDNTATSGGGAVYCRACTLILERNWLTGNMAGTYGNALHIQWLNWAIYGIPQTESVITNNIFYDDETDSTPTVTIHSSQAVMTHNTLIRNPLAVIGVGVWVENTLTDLPARLVMTNNIVGGHAEGVRLVSGSASTEGTLWGTGDWDNTTDWTGAVDTGTVNLWGDPLFVNPAAGDYHISASSPARDAGVVVSITDDVDNESRPHPETDLYDIGADEYHLDDLKVFLPLVVK